MQVKDLIAQLAGVDQEAIVVLRVDEDGGVCGGVGDKHPSAYYYKGDCPVDETESAITLIG